MPSSALLREGLALKMSHVKLATRSYLRDRTRQATSSITSYVVGAGLFAAAGVFLIAACLVGATALFRWIEVKYGLFPAFGAIGALLLAATAICVAFGVRSLHRQPPHFPTLASRLRVAISANPIQVDQIQAVREPTAAVFAPTSAKRTKDGALPEPNGLQICASLVFVATLLGWAVARRWQQARRTELDATGFATAGGDRSHRRRGRATAGNSPAV
jgi:hypothetical protein